MPKVTPFVQSVLKQLNFIAPVSAHAMLDGYGIFSEGIMFGLIADDVLYFKVDQSNLQDYCDARSEPFLSQPHDHHIHMPFYRLPYDIFSDLEDLDHWYEQAYAAALRAKHSLTLKQTSS